MNGKSLIFVVLAAPCLLPPASIRAQDYGHDGKSMVPIRSLAVEYTIHGTVKPESSLIRCQMDLLYRNLSSDTLQALYIRLPRRSVVTGTGVLRPSCHVDSILMYGVPTRPDSVSSDSSLIRIRFSRRLAPGGTVSFLTSFETSVDGLSQSIKRKGAMVVSEHWLPEVCAFRDGHWFLPSARTPSTHPQVGQYNVALTIDSSYTIAAPGELLNEQEFYGLLPPRREDTVSIDVAGVRKPGIGSAVFKPAFTNGKKTYAWRLRSGTAFPIALGQSMAIDRIALQGPIVETYYGRKSGKWKGTYARQAADLVGRCEKMLGQCPRQKLAIAQGQIEQPLALSSGLIVLPEREKKINGLEVPLAIGIARCWLPDILHGDDGTETALADGIAAYVGYGLVDDPNLSYDYLQSLRLHNERMTDESSRDWAEFISVPSWLHILSRTSSDSVVLAAIRNFCSKYQFVGAMPVDFQETLKSEAAGDLDWFCNQWDRPISAFDYRLTDIACIPKGDSFTTTVTISRGTSPAVPLEIGYIISDSDTLFDQVSYRDLDSATDSYTAHCVSKQPAKAAILDPHVWIPDINRSHNWVPIDQGYRCRPATPTFPPYRILEGR